MDESMDSTNNNTLESVEESSDQTWRESSQDDVTMQDSDASTATQNPPQMSPVLQRRSRRLRSHDVTSTANVWLNASLLSATQTDSQSESSALSSQSQPTSTANVWLNTASRSTSTSFELPESSSRSSTANVWLNTSTSTSSVPQQSPESATPASHASTADVWLTTADLTVPRNNVQSQQSTDSTSSASDSNLELNEPNLPLNNPENESPLHHFSSQQSSGRVVIIRPQPIPPLTPPPLPQPSEVITIHRPESSNSNSEHDVNAIHPQEIPDSAMDSSREANTHLDNLIFGMNENSEGSSVDVAEDLVSVAEPMPANEEGTRDLPETSENAVQPPQVVPDSSPAQDEDVPLAQRIRSTALSPSPPKKVKLAAGEKPEMMDTDDQDEAAQCPICFDSWTISGDHRLVALKCGHLFGDNCIKQWLLMHKAAERRCPQCKEKAMMRDIRFLFASKLIAMDNSELVKLRELVVQLEQDKESLSRDLAHQRQVNQESLRIQREQQMKLQELQNESFVPKPQQQSTPVPVSNSATQLKVQLRTRVELCREGGCRILAHNEWKGILVASQSSTNPLFPDFGIRIIDTTDFGPKQLLPLHTKAIRDLKFNNHRKDLLLSVSLDRTAKVFCLTSNSSIMTCNTTLPLWTCCWDADNSNVFYVGSQGGIVLQYDIRNAHSEVNRITTSGDTTPVISLAAVPSQSWLPNAGFLSCRMNRVHVYSGSSNSTRFNTHTLNVEGCFTSLSYDLKTQNMLLSTRPTSSSPHAIHQLHKMSYGPQSSLITSFTGSTTQSNLSRSCLAHVGGDTFVCAYQESEGGVGVWSVAKGSKMSWPLKSESVLDLCPMSINNETFVASLSDKVLRVYKFT